MQITRVTLLGHKDHGKSTLIGNLLIATGSVSEQRIADAKKTSEKLGRRFEPGFILDSFEEERQGALTIDTTRAQVLYKDNAFEFIDVPGHEELIKNMISGASNADLAILMVSAKEDEGIRDQTLRHLFLAKMLGISKIIVAVNKMDDAGYSESRFRKISDGILKFLLAIGLKRNAIFFVPISAYGAENLSSKSAKMPWYKGDSLLDIMAREARTGPGKAARRDLRISVQGTLPQGMLIGRVLSGELRERQNVVVMPQRTRRRISKIFVRGERSDKAGQGQNVAVELDKGLQFNPRGAVICSLGNPIRPLSRIRATIFAVGKPGSATKLNFNGASFDCRIRVGKVIDTTTGKKATGPIKPLDAAQVTIALRSKIAAEPFSKSPQLGRFVLYDGNTFSGIGIVT